MLKATSYLQAGVAAAALLATTPAFAQPAPSGDQPASNQPAASAPNAGDTSDVITVTARRRSENRLNVPVAVEALSGDTLASRGVTRVEDLQIATPGLRLAPTAGRRSNSQYEIRGITTIESLITEDPAVGIYVDDVYRARATGTNQSLYDIANVQTLYGPQGTLFGRNSTGGAVLITSNHPTNEFGGYLEAGYGNFNQFTATGVLNLPVSDRFQIRLAGEHSEEDGYVLNGSTGHKLGGHNSWSGRLSVHWAPADGIDNLLIVSGYRANDEGTPNVLYGFRSSTTPDRFGQVPALANVPAFAGLVTATLNAERAAGYRTTYLTAPGATIPGVPAALTGLTGYLLQGSVLQNTDPYERPRNFAISNTTTIELGDSISLKNIFGYNYTRLETDTDLDGTPLDLVDTYYLTTNRQISDEVQLSGQSSRFNWVIGGLYFQERGTDLQPALQFVASWGTSLLHGFNRSIGVFAQGTYKLTDNLNFTAGARYTWDRREVEYLNSFSNSVGGTLAANGGLGHDFSIGETCNIRIPTNDGPCGISRQASFAEPSYTVSLDYHPDPDTLLYIAHRHGYRSGGFNSRLSPSGTAAIQAATVLPFPPEKVDDVEIGLRGNYRLGGGARIRGSISVYDSWYHDIQKQITQFTNGSGVTIITSAGSATVKGFEADAGLTPFRGLDLDAYASYTDGRYHNFPSPDARPGAAPLVPTVPFNSPKWTFGITASVTPMDNQIGRLTWTTSYSYRSSYYGDNALPTRNEEAHLPHQNNVNMSLNLEHIGGSGLSGGLWVRNLTNDLHYLGVLDLVPTFGVAVATIGEPRTYGFTLRYTFGH